MNPRLFHLIPVGALEARRGAPHYAPDSFEAEGFCHLSFAEQLAGTLEVHFTRPGSVLLFEVADLHGSPELVLEPSRGGALFPHLYRALAWSELVRSWELTRAPNENWGLPGLGSTPVKDDPQGLPWSREAF